MDFDFSNEGNAFRRELEAFLDANRSGDVMDHAPEQFSQTVDRPAKRGLMAGQQVVGGLGPGPHRPAGLCKPGTEDALLDGRFERSGRHTVLDTSGGEASEIQKSSSPCAGLVW